MELELLKQILNRDVIDEETKKKIDRYGVQQTINMILDEEQKKEISNIDGFELVDRRSNPEVDNNNHLDNEKQWPEAPPPQKSSVLGVALAAQTGLVLFGSIQRLTSRNFEKIEENIEKREEQIVMAESTIMQSMIDIQKKSKEENSKMGLCKLLVSPSADVSNQWKLELVRNALHSVEISGNYFGGEIFRYLLIGLKNRLRLRKKLLVHIICSPELLASDDRDAMLRLVELYPNRLKYLETKVLPKKNDKGSKENHVKMVCVDEKYFVVGGTNFEDHMGTKGVEDQIVTWSSTMYERFVLSAARDMDVVGSSERVARDLRTGFFKLFRYWNNLMKSQYLCPSSSASEIIECPSCSSSITSGVSFSEDELAVGGDSMFRACFGPEVAETSETTNRILEFPSGGLKSSVDDIDQMMIAKERSREQAGLPLRGRHRLKKEFKESVATQSKEKSKLSMKFLSSISSIWKKPPTGGDAEFLECKKEHIDNSCTPMYFPVFKCHKHETSIPEFDENPNSVNVSEDAVKVIFCKGKRKKNIENHSDVSLSTHHLSTSPGREPTVINRAVSLKYVNAHVERKRENSILLEEEYLNEGTEELVRIIASAKHSIKFAQLNFNPPNKLKQEIYRKIQEGVHVQLITTSADEATTLASHFYCWANRINYFPLMCGGLHQSVPDMAQATNLNDYYFPNVEIYEYAVKRTTYHKKVVVVDGTCMTIGSYNCGKKSHFGDDELIFKIQSKEVCENVLRVLDDDLTRCRRVGLEEAASYYLNKSKRFLGEFQEGLIAKFVG